MRPDLGYIFPPTFDSVGTRASIATALAAAMTMVAALAAAPASAAVEDWGRRPGAVTCTFRPAAATLDIDAHGDADSFDYIWVSTTDAGKLRVNRDSCAGGIATVRNTDTITITGGTGDQYVTLHLANGRLAPGLTDEATPEIEVRMDLGEGSDEVRIWGSAQNDHIRLGSASGDHFINLNARESSGVDADVVFDGVELVVVEGRQGADAIRASGGAGTGLPLSLVTNLRGGPGIDAVDGGPRDDALTGGDGNDRLRGGPGGDLLISGHGDDVMRGDDGPDSFRSGQVDGADAMFGGAGVDRVSYVRRRDGGVTVTLDNVADDGRTGSERDNVHGDVEVVIATDGNDVIRGNSSRTMLHGVGGDDRLFGRGGRDTLDGGAGDDVITGGTASDEMMGDDGADTFYASGDGSPDLVKGGPGEDSCACGDDDEQESVP